MNCSVLTAFAMILDTGPVQAKFKSIEPTLKRLLEWAATVAVLTAKEIIEGMELKVLRRKSDLKEATFLTSNNLVLCEPTTKQIRQVF